MAEPKPTSTPPPKIMTPNVQLPTTQGKPPAPVLPDLPDPGAEEKESAKQREDLRKLLGLLGMDLPISMTDLTNQSAKLMQLQEKAAQVIQDLQDEVGGGIGMEGAQGPATLETKTKLDALNDLQQQLKGGAELFKNYAYQYFAGTEKPLTLSQGQIFQAYGKNLITAQDAADRLGKMGMEFDDVVILLKMETAEKVAARKKEQAKASDQLELKVQTPRILSQG